MTAWLRDRLPFWLAVLGIYALGCWAVFAWATVPAPGSCAAYWAAHTELDHHAFNREHHIVARCMP